MLEEGFDVTLDPVKGEGCDRLLLTKLSIFLIFFYCIAELAIKPCRSSRSNTRGGFEKFPDTCKTGTKTRQNKQETQTKQKKKPNTNTKERRQVSLDGETGGEQKRGETSGPKLSYVELHEEA